MAANNRKKTKFANMGIDETDELEERTGFNAAQAAMAGQVVVSRTMQ